VPLSSCVRIKFLYPIKDSVKLASQKLPFARNPACWTIDYAVFSTGSTITRANLTEFPFSFAAENQAEWTPRHTWTVADHPGKLHASLVWFLRSSTLCQLYLAVSKSPRPLPKALTNSRARCSGATLVSTTSDGLITAHLRAGSTVDCLPNKRVPDLVVQDKGCNWQNDHKVLIDGLRGVL
jgi:hypothetical protein